MADNANTDRHFTPADLDAFLADLEIEDCIVDKPLQVRLTPVKSDQDNKND